MLSGCQTHVGVHWQSGVAPQRRVLHQIYWQHRDTLAVPWKLSLPFAWEVSLFCSSVFPCYKSQRDSGMFVGHCFFNVFVCEVITTQEGLFILIQTRKITHLFIVQIILWNYCPWTRLGCPRTITLATQKNETGGSHFNASLDYLVRPSLKINGQKGSKDVDQ